MEPLHVLRAVGLVIAVAAALLLGLVAFGVRGAETPPAVLGGDRINGPVAAGILIVVGLLLVVANGRRD